MDFLPTFLDIAGLEIPVGLKIDGKSFKNVLLSDKKSTHDRFYYYSYTHLQAVRDKQWKLVLPRKAKPSYMKWAARKIEEVKDVQLFNLQYDKEEQHNLASQNPKKVEELKVLIEQGRRELGDHDRLGDDARFFDSVSKEERSEVYNRWKVKSEKNKTK